jgi:Sec-independent protein translocase protein TatA
MFDIDSGKLLIIGIVALVVMVVRRSRSRG